AHTVFNRLRAVPNASTAASRWETPEALQTPAPAFFLRRRRLARAPPGDNRKGTMRPVVECMRAAKTRPDYGGRSSAMIATKSRHTCPVCDSQLNADSTQCPTCHTDLRVFTETSEIALDFYN